MEFAWLKPTDDLEACFSIRREVFMEEQGFVEEFDEIDERAWHLLVTDAGTPAATLRLYQQDGAWSVGRICVVKHLRGKGIAAEMMRSAAEKCRNLGGEKLGLSAQVQAKPFYEKQGYLASGETYLDEGCPHIYMWKAL